MSKTVRPDLVESDSQTWQWVFFTFLTVLAFHLIWIWQGFDMTDEGYNLTNQWLVINGSKYYCYRMIWLSDLAGGIWLKIVGNLGLIGARLGWALIMGLTGLVSFLILRRCFHPLAALSAVLAVTFAINYHGIMTINYNNFPAFTLIGAAGLLLVSQETGPSRYRQMWFAAVGGLLLGLGVMARFPLILSLFLPFVPPVARALFARHMPPKPCWIRAFVSLVSAFLTILACLVLLHLTNHLTEYWNAIYDAIFAAPSGSLHAPASLLHVYYKTGKSAMLWGLKFLSAGLAIALGLTAIFHLIRSLSRKAAKMKVVGIVLLFASALLVVASFTLITPTFVARHLSQDGFLEDATLLRIQTARIGTLICSGFLTLLSGGVLLFPHLPREIQNHFMKVRMKWYWIAATLFGLLFFGLVQQQAGGRHTYSLALPGICFVLAGLQLLLGGVTPHSFTSRQIDRFVLLAMGLFVASVKLLGSNNGISSAKDAIWLLFPTVFLLVPESIRLITQRFPFRRAGGGKADSKANAQIIKKFAIAAMFALALVGFCIRCENPYRDLPDRFQLTSQLEHKRLRGIFTSSGRTASVNELLEEITHLVNPGDVTLAYNNIPMIHYVTQTVPALGHPWPTQMIPAELKAKLYLLSSTGIPSVVVLAKTNTRIRTWGTREITAFSRLQIEKFHIGIEWIEQHGYREVWANRDFVIYVFPNLSRTLGKNAGISQVYLSATEEAA